ncbi:DNA replication complex GINS protein SLD5 [Rutidosis leptorrhynchoides]|uniref:DNA replication complex GINS protein SLD5 n=1 Tax=Rutidosis leptorrhynchoides TaxID=125765 RepID=UPI003A992FB1
MESGSPEQDTGGSKGEGLYSDNETLISTQLLKRSWRNEKAAPQILQFQSSLVQTSRERIEEMEQIVDELVEKGEDPISVSLHQMDMDRTSFLLRSYLRTRLHKIQKFMFHIKDTPDLWDRLSKEEQAFALGSIEAMKKHLEQSVLSKLPERYGSHLQQSSISEGNDMVPEPNLDAFVICRTRKFIGPLPVDDSGEENPLDMYAGDIYALRYKTIKPLIESGELDLV